MKIRKIFHLILITLLLNGCDSFYQPAVLEPEVPDGPPEYRAGWYDGCRSGLSVKRHFAGAFVYEPSFGSGIYQHDPVYQSAWSSGFLNCNTVSSMFSTRHYFAVAPLE